MTSIFSSNFSELRGRLFFLLAALLVFRIGAHVPVPGINPEQLQSIFAGKQGGLLGMFNVFSGGALSRFTIFALGIMPYISASIVMQLMGFFVPAIERLKKEGEVGRRTMTRYTRLGTLGLALVQSFGISVMLQSTPGLVLHPGLAFQLVAVVTLTAGTIFLMWLGEQITERGLGNGISIIIFAGIASGVPNGVAAFAELVRTGSIAILSLIGITALGVATTYAVVFIEKGQRRVPITYAKRQASKSMYGSQVSHLPLKLNMAGVTPPIFASAIMLLPATILGWFNSESAPVWVKDVLSSLGYGHWVHTVLYATAIIGFAFFYAKLMFNSKETAENLKKSGGFVLGMRPGEPTARYLEGVLMRLTTVGALYITLVCLLPEVLVLKYNVPFNFGGTSLLIMVVVTMDLMAQVQNYFASHQYNSLLKKGSFKTSAF
jgi:preprotein translocase subunit SecY